MPEPIEGGLRDRLTFESAARLLRHGLTAKGWFSNDLDANVHPVTFRTTPITDATTIVPNVITIGTGPQDPDQEAETGSNLVLTRTELWVTIYAQNDAVGRHLQGDAHAILAGQMPSLGLTEAGFHVYDWRQQAPTDFTYPPPDADELFWVDLRELYKDREHDPETGLERDTWYVVGIMEEYR